MKFKFISKTLLIISLIGLIVVPGLNAVDSCTPNQDIETTDEIDDYDIYRFCYIESGDVDHDQHSFYRIGSFWLAPPGFGIGRVGVELKGWRDDARLTVKSIFGTTTYNYDVYVYVRGFIGYAWPTVSIFRGILKGYAFIAEVSLLN